LSNLLLFRNYPTTGGFCSSEIPTPLALLYGSSGRPQALNKGWKEAGHARAGVGPSGGSARSLLPKFVSVGEGLSVRFQGCLTLSLVKTHEILVKKISLTRIDSIDKEQKGAVIGWEYGPPRRGERYSVYLGDGKVLRTSPVEDVKETHCALLIKTMNSVYRVEYLKGKSSDRSEHKD
jgi:hypothetical protein